MSSEARKVMLRGIGQSSVVPDGLEDAFPGRWNPRREMDSDIGVLIHAVAQALEAARWWQRGSGQAVAAGQVFGVDMHAFAPARRFALDLESGGAARARPSDFLFSLPSTASAMVGAAFGLEQYQASVAQHGLSGFKAMDHAAGLLRMGRMTRMVVGTLTAIDSVTSRMMAEVGLTDADAGPFKLAIAWCLEAGDAAHMSGATCIEAARDGSTGIDTAELLADIPASYRSLAAPSLLALHRLQQQTLPQEVHTLVHRDTSFEAHGLLTIRIGDQPMPGCPTW